MKALGLVGAALALGVAGMFLSGQKDPLADLPDLPVTPGTPSLAPAGPAGVEYPQPSVYITLPPEVQPESPYMPGVTMQQYYDVWNAIYSFYGGIEGYNLAVAEGGTYDYGLYRYLENVGL